MTMCLNDCRINFILIIHVSFSGKDYLIEALKYHLLKTDQRLIFNTPRTKPRQPIGVPKVSAHIVSSTLCILFE